MLLNSLLSWHNPCFHCPSINCQCCHCQSYCCQRHCCHCSAVILTAVNFCPGNLFQLPCIAHAGIPYGVVVPLSLPLLLFITHLQRIHSLHWKQRPLLQLPLMSLPTRILLFFSFFSLLLFSVISFSPDIIGSSINY